MVVRKNANGEIVFADHPEFRPNLTPREMFKMGSFGGTYWRPIYSNITKRKYHSQHLKYPAAWWRGISDDELTSTKCNPNTNKYKVKVGTSLRFWESKGWIHRTQPYGWVQWYCDFYNGKRGADDERQIKRWLGLAGPNGRFRKYLITLIIKNKTRYNDYAVSPKIRQTLLHWGYELTLRDFNAEVRSRKK